MPTRAAIALLLLASTTLAADTRPATAPAGMPAMDYSSPRAVFKTYLQRLLAGDMDAGYLFVALPEDEKERDMLRAYLAQGNSQIALQSALVARFGMNAVKDQSKLDAVRKPLKVIDTFKETIVEDAGKLVPTNDGAAGESLNLKVIMFKKVEGQWRVVPPRKMPDDPESLKRWRAIAGAAEVTCKEIRAGKYATVDLALTEYNKRMALVTTRPAGQ